MSRPTNYGTMQQVMEIYAGVWGITPDWEGVNYWVGEINAGRMSFVDTAASFFAQPLVRNKYNGLSGDALLEALYGNIFRITNPDEAGMDYWRERMEDLNITSINSANIGRLAMEMIDGMWGNAAATDTHALYRNFVTAAEAFYTLQTSMGVAAYSTLSSADQAAFLALAADLTDSITASSTAAQINQAVQATQSGLQAFVPDGPVVPGEVYFLTAATDVIVGTSNDDLFIAPISQNPFIGGVSNTLSSADRLDGGAGTDTLRAEIIPEFFGAIGGNQIDIQPRTVRIENIEFEARDLGGALPGTVAVDAKHMLGVERIGSVQSDGTLWIENLTTLMNDGVTKRNTSDLTITMDHTGNTNTFGASDLIVYFDDNYLLSGQTREGQGFYFLLDQDADLLGDPLLDNIDVDGIRFSLNDGPEIRIRSDAANEANTHDEFVAALQQSLAALINNGTLPSGTTLTVDPSRIDFTYLDDGSRSSDIPAIVLTAGDGSRVTPIGFSRVQDAIGDYNVYGRMSSRFEQEQQPVSVNVELEKVGRGGNGGDLIIGAKSQLRGIEVFDVTVNGGSDLPSNLEVLGTTAGGLRTVNIRSDDASRDNFASLTIRGAAAQEAFNQGSLNRVDANEFYGNLTLGSVNAVNNLSTLVAMGGGNITFNGEITGVDGNYSYTTGAGNDIINLILNTEAIDRAGTGLVINTGAGNDNVTLNSAGDGPASQLTMSLLNNVVINTGAGNDNVRVQGDVRANIDTGSGNDFVRIDSVSNGHNGTLGNWFVGQVTGPQNFGSRVLYEAQLTVTFAGFESTVAVRTDANGNYIANQMTLNAAIREAIQTDPVLNRLLTVTDQDGVQQIQITSRVGGENNLGISLFQPTLVANAPAANQVVAPSGGALTALVQGMINTTPLTSANLTNQADVIAQFNAPGNNIIGNVAANGAGDAAVAPAATSLMAFNNGGSSDATVGFNFSVVNPGAGNDIVVFHSNDNSANVLQLTGSFDTVHVVNFHDVSPDAVNNAAQVGNHAIDFTTFLNNRIDPSAVPAGNQQSAVPIAITLNNTQVALAGSAAGNATAQANSVNMLRFDATGAAANAVTWQGLTAANLVAALNGAAGASVLGNGNINAGTLSAVANTATLIGNVQQHIVMVENAQNAGEYKVFHLSSTVDTTTGTTGGLFDTASARLLGTLDFGASINFQLVGSADWNALVPVLLANADGVEPPVPVVTYTLAQALAAAATPEGLAEGYRINPAEAYAAQNKSIVEVTLLLQTIDAILAGASNVPPIDMGAVNVTWTVRDSVTAVLNALADDNQITRDALSVSLTNATITQAQYDALVEALGDRFILGDVVIDDVTPGQAVLVVDSITTVPADVKAGEAFDVVVELQNTGDADPINPSAVLTVNGVEYQGVINGLVVTFTGVTVAEAAENVALNVTVRADNAAEVSDSLNINVVDGGVIPQVQIVEITIDGDGIFSDDLDASTVEDGFVFTGDLTGLSAAEITITNFSAGQSIVLDQLGTNFRAAALSEVDGISVDGNNLAVTMFTGTLLAPQVWEFVFVDAGAEVLDAVTAAAENFDAQFAAVNGIWADWLVF